MKKLAADFRALTEEEREKWVEHGRSGTHQFD